MESDDGADAGKLSGGHHLEFLVFAFGVVDGVGVERAQHRVDGRAHHLVGVERVYIHQVEIAVNLVEHLHVLGHVEVVALASWADAAMKGSMSSTAS